MDELLVIDTRDGRPVTKPMDPDFARARAEDLNQIEGAKRYEVREATFDGRR